MRYSTVLLDVGETLIGPAVPFGVVYANVLADHGLQLPPERLQAAIVDTMAWSMREIPPGIDRYGHFPGGEAEYWLRFSQRVLQHATGDEVDPQLAVRALDGLRNAFKLPTAWQVYPDVVPALEALKAQGVQLGIVSNWDSRLNGVLEMLDLARHFAVIGVSHLEGFEKPDPELFRIVLRKLDADPASALHIGDVPELDGVGARAAGVDCLIVDRKDRLADCGHPTIPDFTDLPRRAEHGYEIGAS
ncbi:HAD-IA family hydrolase [bacterium]|nr:HAD-IA family hydrolase [bacterium]